MCSRPAQMQSTTMMPKKKEKEIPVCRRGKEKCRVSTRCLLIAPTSGYRDASTAYAFEISWRSIISNFCLPCSRSTFIRLMTYSYVNMVTAEAGTARIMLVPMPA